MKTCHDRWEQKQKCVGFQFDFLHVNECCYFPLTWKQYKSHNLPNVWNILTVKTAVQQPNMKCTFQRHNNQKYIRMRPVLKTIRLQRLKLMLWTELKSHFNDSSSCVGVGFLCGILRNELPPVNIMTRYQPRFLCTTAHSFMVVFLCSLFASVGIKSITIESVHVALSQVVFVECGVLLFETCCDRFKAFWLDILVFVPFQMNTWLDVFSFLFSFILEKQNFRFSSGRSSV